MFAPVTSGGGSEGRGEQETTTHNQNAGPGKAIQRTSVQGHTNHRAEWARMVVLARTPEGEEYQELHTIVGLRSALGEGGLNLR